MTVPSAPRPAARVAISLIAMAAGAGLALDTWQRGWSTPGFVAIAGAALAALSALLGRATRRLVFERAAPFIAVIALVVGILGTLALRLID